VSLQLKVVVVVDEFSALRLSNAAALFERLRSFAAGVVLAAQSVEGLHDDEGERTRLLNSASTLIAHRLADPDPIVTRAGTIRRAERSHQLDATGATGMGSLRLQDTYRVDPNDLRSLPPGVAWIVTGGRAAKVAVSRGGQALPGAPARRGKRGDMVVGRGDPVLVRAGVATADVEDIHTDERLLIADGPDVVAAEPEVSGEAVGEGTPMGSADSPLAAVEPPSAGSPYAQGL
jgi:hypothetical protein